MPQVCVVDIYIYIYIRLETSEPNWLVQYQRETSESQRLDYIVNLGTSKREIAEPNVIVQQRET